MADSSVYILTKAEAAALQPRYIGAVQYKGLHWTGVEEYNVRVLAASGVDLEKSADVLGREARTVAQRAHDMRLKMPPSWRVALRGVIVPKAKSFAVAYPYIIRPRDEHADIMLINSLVPRGLPEWIRADICQDMMVALLSGEIERDKLAASVTPYLRNVLKMHPIKYGLLSLDAPIGGEDARPLYDVIADNSEPYDESEGEDLEADELPTRKPLWPADIRQDRATRLVVTAKLPANPGEGKPAAHGHSSGDLTPRAKNFACLYCERRFASKWDVDQHANSKHRQH